MNRLEDQQVVCEWGDLDLLPEVTIATATPFFLLKYVVTSPNVGQKIIPLPTPVHSPCASKSCHRFVHSEVMKMPSSCTTVPIQSVGRYNPASKARPEKVDMKNNTHSCRDPTQETVLCDSPRVPV